MYFLLYIFKDYICNPNPCSNGGTCVLVSATTAYCQCPNGFSGATCQVGSNVCSSNPCLNGGTCSPVNSNQYKCSCTSGFTGSICQNISISTTSTTTAATTQSPTLNCTDTNSANCQLYASLNFCKSNYYVNGVTVPTYCPKSCRVTNDFTNDFALHHLIYIYKISYLLL